MNYFYKRNLSCYFYRIYIRKFFKYLLLKIKCYIALKERAIYFYTKRLINNRLGKDLVAKLAPPYVQSAWEFRGKGFELRG